MKILKFKPQRSNINESKIINELKACLKNDGVIILKTDTIYGFSCLASSKKALQRLRRIKGRNDDKAFLVLVDSFEMIEDLTFLSPAKRRFLEDEKIFSKKSTTILLKLKKKFPAELLGKNKNDKIALRLPKSRFLIKMIKELAEPLVSTSLNISGDENISDPKKIKNVFSEDRLADLVLDSGPSRRKKASRLIDFSSSNKGLLLRR